MKLRQVKGFWSVKLNKTRLKMVIKRQNKCKWNCEKDVNGRIRSQPEEATYARRNSWKKVLTHDKGTWSHDLRACDILFKTLIIF